MEKPHTIELQDLIDWMPTAKIIFASSSKERKFLYACADGTFEVMKDGYTILKTLSDFQAVEMYNDIS